jgi:hypothetical protein
MFRNRPGKFGCFFIPRILFGGLGELYNGRYKVQNSFGGYIHTVQEPQVIRPNICISYRQAGRSFIIAACGAAAVNIMFIKIRG